MTTTVLNCLKAAVLLLLALAIAGFGLYVGEVDDAPGAGGLALLLMAGGVVLAVKAFRNRLPGWAAGTAIVVGIVVAAFAAVLAHGVAVSSPLFRPPQGIPSVAGPALAADQMAAAGQARAQVHAVMLEQNLPGVSVAVGRGGRVVWAEGFGIRDIATRAPVTPTTRFHIGSAASAVAPQVGPLGLRESGTDTAGDWSPEHIGEPEEDAPPLAMMRRLVFEPLGLMALDPLAGERATFYVPRSDDHNPRRGRRLMYMRDLACCVNGQAFSSTPSDLVRVAMATNPGPLNGTLAGGTVMSVVPLRDGGAVAVTSNMAYAHTAALAGQIAETFGGSTARP